MYIFVWFVEKDAYYKNGPGTPVKAVPFGNKPNGADGTPAAAPKAAAAKK